MWSPLVHHCFHYSPTPVSILSRIILIQAHPTSVLPSTSRSSRRCIYFRFPHTKTPNVPLLFFMRATHLAHEIQECSIKWTPSCWNLYHDLLSVCKVVIYCYSVYKQNAWNGKCNLFLFCFRCVLYAYSADLCSEQNVSTQLQRMCLILSILEVVAQNHYLDVLHCSVSW